MSVTISSPSQICNAPYNNSTSKMLYSFPKDARFKNNKQNMDRPYYEINAKVSKRATNFGYGTKYDFTKDMPKTPPPGSYRVQSAFDRESSTKKGFGFGNSRQNMVVTGPLAQTRNNKNPGPGAYQIPHTRSRAYYSLKGKSVEKSPDMTPGPGNYQVKPTMNHSGSNFYSKFKDHKATVFTSSTDRFKKTVSQFPGPGNYITKNVQLNSTGKYALSKMQNCKVRSFGSAARKSLNQKSQTPGPGNYRTPSDFGYYSDQKQILKQKLNKNFTIQTEPSTEHQQRKTLEN